LNSLKIAVIGSGISGLSAAWLLSQRHDVTLIEADDRVGGHSNTFMCPAPEGQIPVDTGFIVYNNQTYPNLSALFEYLCVPTADSNMGFAVSLGKGKYEYSGAGLTSLIGHTSNLLNPSHYRMIRDLVRFFKSGSAQIENLGEDVSLAEFVRAQNYSQEFIDLHLLPMAGAIWSCTPDQMLNYPAKCFLRFCDNHGLLNFYDRPTWRTVEGGSTEYVQRLMADSRMQIITACPVQKIIRNGFNVIIEGIKGYRESFDHIVIATHADQALKMLAVPTAEETRILSPFQYSKNTAILHHDESFMPRRKRLWSSWNYVGETDKTNSASVTYWMNALQPLKTDKNIFVTLNANHKPKSIIKEFEYTHPVFNEQTSKMQKQLWSLQGTNRTWFCGAHFGSGFHEDGLQSGLAVAEQLGGALRPWNLATADQRIHVTSTTPREKPNFLEAAE
jgi:uncharacterized protein